jgi:hypothetical protein
MSSTTPHRPGSRAVTLGAALFTALCAGLLALAAAAKLQDMTDRAH